jgi:RNA polymerase sigma-70 factor (sigma-E family)
VGQYQAEFAAFYEQSRDACLRAVTASVADRWAAEDLVAEAFARAWAGWGRLRRHPAPSAWVVRTALNARVSWWRRRRHEVGWSGYEGPSPDDDRSAPFDDSLLAALQRLPARQREVVALRVLLDLDTEMTARALGIAPGTVTTHLFRAVAALRQGRDGAVSPPPTMEITR